MKAGNGPSRGAKEDRVLFVEDDQTTRQIMATLLRNAGILVDAVASGEEALRRMQIRPYAIVVTDYRMPEMNGLELASIIRASGSGGTWQPDPPTLIALSGGLSELERQIAQSVFDRIIVKPVKASVLESALKSVLESRVAG